MMIGFGDSATDYDFYAFNASGQVWNGSAFVTWSDGSYLSYRIAATQQGASGEFRATAPAGTVRYVMRQSGATLALSYIEYADRIDGANIDADGYDLEQSLKVLLAVVAGEATVTPTSAIFEAVDGSKARVTATTTTDGDRTSITRDVT